MHKDIQSVMQGDRVFPPSTEFRKQAVLKAPALERMYDRAAEDYVGFWADLAVAEIDWHRPFTVPLDDSEAPNFRWFCDGQLNVSHNCLDVQWTARTTVAKSAKRVNRPAPAGAPKPDLH